MCRLICRESMTRMAFLLAVALSMWAGDAIAEDYSIGTIEIAMPWARATPKGANIAGAYMTLRNKGSTPDRLVGGSVAVAGRFEVHRMVMEQGVAKMRPVKGGLEIKPGETVELKPGSFHVMFVGLKKPLSAGDHFKATLVFEKAGQVSVDYDVRAMGSEPGGTMPGMKMPGK